MSTIYVVLPDNDVHEGLGPPVAAFLTKDEADAYQKHIREGYRDFFVCEVPVMRFFPAAVEPLPDLTAVQVQPS